MECALVRQLGAQRSDSVEHQFFVSHWFFVMVFHGKTHKSLDDDIVLTADSNSDGSQIFVVFTSSFFSTAMQVFVRSNIFIQLS